MVAVLLVPGLSGAAEPGPLLARLKAVGKEGAGNAEAAKAWQELVKLGPAALPAILTALDDADATAANWLRSAVDAIAEHEMNASRPLPADKLEAFVKDTKHSGLARRLAYEWLVRVDASAPKRLLPGMLNDPGQEMRRDAVAVALSEAKLLLEKDDKEAAKAAFQKVFAAARDNDQVDEIAKQLDKLGVKVDLPAHFGFIQRWVLVAPFDNRGGKGFVAAYPPEKQVDLAAAYSGKEDLKTGWKVVTTTPAAKGELKQLALVDLNKVIGKHMGAVAYAFAAVESPLEQPVDIRVSSNNAIKLFLNGKEIFNREEYHHNGGRVDGHVGRGVLKKGRNEILLKVCQNEQKDDWAQSWSFQLRVCDAIGGAVPLKVLDEQPAEKKE